MGKQLIAITIGPIQDFIYASRRTRDLWFGSMILSEISKSAARSMREQKAHLIFPHPDTDLTPWSDSRVTNIILAEVDDTSDARAITGIAETSARSTWLHATDQALQRARGLVRADLWDAQKNDVVEFYAAWGPLPDGGYRTARRELMRAVAGRKALRSFIPSGATEMGLKKSSLDGARESVISEGIRTEKRLANQLRLSRGEELDVVGVTRRLAQDKPYRSVSGITVDPWLRGIERSAPAAAQELKHLANGDLRHDGTILFLERHPYLRKEEKVSEARLEAVAQVLRGLKSSPQPYYAVLVADGDKMGSLIAKIESAPSHRNFSEKLGRFASKAQEIVEANYGALVFSGGDDVVGFLPEDLAVECGRALAAGFAELAPGATLSVGIAIVHYMEPLEDALSYARAAEKHAKSGEGDPNERDREESVSPEHERNALAVHLHKRSGAPLRYRAQWTASPADNIDVFVEAHRRNVIPDGCAYELARLAGFYKAWPCGESRTTAMRLDAARIVGRKKKAEYEDIRPRLLQAVQNLNYPSDLKRLADEIILARHIVVSVKQAAIEG